MDYLRVYLFRYEIALPHQIKTEVVHLGSPVFCGSEVIIRNFRIAQSTLITIEIERETPILGRVLDDYDELSFQELTPVKPTL